MSLYLFQNIYFFILSNTCVQGSWKAVAGGQDNHSISKQMKRDKNVQHASMQSEIMEECESDWSFSESEEEGKAKMTNENAGPPSMDDKTAPVENDDVKNANSSMQAENGDGMISSGSSRRSSHESCYGIEIVPQKQQPKDTERFTFLKVWTNVYGLAVGMFCVVYSLLLPNELSGFTFCICLWVVGVYECVQMSGLRRLCCCCFFMKNKISERKKRMLHEISMMRHARSSASSNSHCHVQNKSDDSAMVLTCLSSLLLLGIVLKTAGGISSGRLFGNIEVTGEALASTLIPAVGVACIRNMRKIENIQNTMELSMPMCSMGSMLCMLCIVLMAEYDAGSSQQVSCVWDFFWENAGTAQRQVCKNCIFAFFCIFHTPAH